LDDTHNGDPYINDAFITKLNSFGTELIYSTYLGGSEYDSITGMVVDEGEAYITGDTKSTDFPITSDAFATNFHQATCGFDVCSDAFAAKLNTSGSDLLYSTYLGGFGQDNAYGIALDNSGAAYLTGTTTSTDFPTTAGAFDRSYDGSNCGVTTPETPCQDAFVVKVHPDGKNLLYGTFLGESGNDYGYSIAVDSSGAAYVTGYTSSFNFPTTSGTFDRNLSGEGDTFVTKLRSNGSGLIYSTFLGGSSYDASTAIAVDGSGAAYIAGRTDSADFPTIIGAYDRIFNSASDVFVAKLNPTGSAPLSYGTFLGGARLDEGLAIAIDQSGAAYVAGYTGSDSFPTTPGAYNREVNNHEDGFVAKLAVTPTYSISGRIQNNHGAGVAGMTVSAGNRTAITARDGLYTISKLLAGTYAVTPSSKLYRVTPTSRTVTVPASASNQNFTAVPSPLYVPLSMVAETEPPPGPCPDDIEDNDRPDQARPLTLVGQPCTGSFQDDPQGTDDYFRLDLQAGQTINADLTNIATGADYDLVLYDAALTQLAVSKIPGSDDEHIGPFSVPQTGRYYIRLFLRTKSNVATNTYVLRVRVS
jgi:hypothetical protein